MEQYTLIAPCHFGLESVLKKELIDLGFEIQKVSDGRIAFTADGEGIARANVHLRTAERVMLQMGEFEAHTFTELFDAVKEIPWEDVLPKDAKFWVSKASTKNSDLFSASDIQSIVKKAMVEAMKRKYPMERFPEDGAEYPVRVFINKNMVSVALETSGVSLHKRGYRTLVGDAPISETLAAALLMLTPWRADRLLVDPFCGSGTFPIEAAMMGCNIAPGLKRDFTAMAWENLIPKATWTKVKKEAEAQIRTDVKLQLQGYDLNRDIVKCAMENARAAGVGDQIHFQQKSVSELSSPKKYGFIVTNPPYGERLEEKEALPDLYRMMAASFDKLDTWSKYIITSYEDAEQYLGRKADKNRKIYNGMIKAYFYQYMGPKPPRKPREN